MSSRTLWHPAHLHPTVFRAPPAIERLSGALAQARDALRTWRRRSRERQELGALSDRMLSDIGITRADAVFLSSKPFWQE